MGRGIVTGSKLGMWIATVVLLAGAAVGQAQQAQKAPQTASAAAAGLSTATAAFKATAGMPSAAKSTADTQASDGLTSDQLKEARDDGFKPVTRGKATLYCKSEIIVGSAFPMHTC